MTKENFINSLENVEYQVNKEYASAFLEVFNTIDIDFALIFSIYEDNRRIIIDFYFGKNHCKYN